MIRERIYAELRRHGMLQKDLAAAIGATPQELNNFLRRRQPISLKKLEKIYRVLGM